MKKISTIVLFLSSLLVAQNKNEIIRISADLELLKLSENSYIHISYFENETLRFPSNGLVFINNGKAFLFDTPMREEITKDLIKWLIDSLNVEITGFVPNHWHNDCIAGLDYLHQLNIISYANELTIKIAESHQLPVPKCGFKDSLLLKLNDEDIFCFYPGAGHSEDNIVVWIPSEKILFAGCMAKSIDSQNLGNLSEADTAEWPHTIRKVLQRFPEAEIVIPGHGDFKGRELLTHTLKLLEKN